MYWYLITTGDPVSGWDNGVWNDSIVMAADLVFNAISYDGVSPYTPDAGLMLQSSDNVYQIGDVYNG